MQLIGHVVVVNVIDVRESDGTIEALLLLLFRCNRWLVDLMLFCFIESAALTYTIRLDVV